jgi:hypothetical protein
VAVVFLGSVALGCSGASSPDSSRPQKAETWYRRAQHELKTGDFEHAHDSAESALAIVPEDPEVRTLAGAIALTALDFSEALRLLKGVRTTEAAGMRGRALWYKGDLEGAADELETMLADPAVKDDWAKEISKLARNGSGRAPFTLQGAMLAAVEMVHVSATAPFFVVPVEIDGESVLAEIATGTGEVVLDRAARPEPSWVSLRFGERFEVVDVPALSKDLSGRSKELGVPVRALLGVNLLRHVNATFDFTGHQFVARNFAPPPPPAATRIDLRYARGGAMLVQIAFGSEGATKAELYVDTQRPFPLALDAEGWKKAGVELAGLTSLVGDPEQKLRQGTVPLVRLGVFDVPHATGLFGLPIADLQQQLQVDVDGILGAGLLYPFRGTFADGGRLLWIEDDLALDRMRAASGMPAAVPPPPALSPPSLGGAQPGSTLAPPRLDTPGPTFDRPGTPGSRPDATPPFKHP